jgi:hypothetical protein
MSEVDFVFPESGGPVMSNSDRLSPLQKFLVRNFDLLPAGELASFLNVEPDVIFGMFDALGLPRTEPMDRERAFPLIVRRNHDILSHGLIARLLSMSMTDYERALQEMDFLAVKIGAKPDNVGDLDVNGFDESSCAYFKEYTANLFQGWDSWEKPFSFLSEFQDVEDSPPDIRDDLYPPLRMMYSYCATHGDFLLTGEDFYNDGILSRLRNRGVNAGWLPILFRDIAPSTVFPEFGKGHQIRIENLRRQVKKALKYGIKLFAYINEPRFMPGEFFEKYPQAKGMVSLDHPDHFGLCTSSQMVRQWMKESAGYLFSQVPDIGGILIISASEYRTNCFSHVCQTTCPACESRGIPNVLADTANIVAEAAQATKSNARVIQWLWGWDFILPTERVKDALSALNPNVEVMVDWARHNQVDIHGVKSELIEYTIAHMSPSNFARGVIDTAREQSRRVHAKCSIVTTVEGNAIPYIPVMTNIDLLFNELRGLHLDGMLGCWIFGAYPGRNMEMLAHSGEDDAARSMALKFYGSGADEAVEAWRLFADGMRKFPHSLEVLYHSAINCGPGLRLSMEPEPWRHGMGAMASERIDEITQPFGPEIVIKAFREAAECFEKGIAHLEKAVQESDRQKYRDENTKDLGICKAYKVHLLTAANYTEYVIIRNKFIHNSIDNKMRARLIKILCGELDNAREMLYLCTHDSRIGYEGAIGYFYTPSEIIEKMYDINVTLNVLEEK